MALVLPPSPDAFVDIERVARELASEGGRIIEAALSRELTVEYKTEGRGEAAPTDPVSELDRSIEQLVRDRLAERFPEHGVIGEELDVQPPTDAEFLWVIDPLDGTANFLNGYPFVACSVGVLHRGRPVAGAIWCSTTHRYRPGVYHASEGAPLSLDGAPFERLGRAGVRRRLAAAPGGSSARTVGWDHRVTGSAATECAFVAAGVFNSAVFWSPGIWDVAAGVVLARSAGIEVRVRGSGRGATWHELLAFEPPSRVRDGRTPTLRDWRRPLLIGEPEAISLRLEAMRKASGVRWPWSRARR